MVKDQFTLDGKLKLQPGVTKERARFLKGLYEAARGGSRVAEAQLVELFTSTNASFSMAHLINIDFIPQLPEELKELDGFAGERTVKDFNPVVLRSLIAAARLEGAGIDEHGAAAIVPEGTPFPKVTVKSDEESFYQKLRSRGVRFDFTFQSIINDLVGELENMPAELLKITKDTVYAEIFDALLSAEQYLRAVELPDGSLSTPNAALSPKAVLAGAIDLSTRKINDNEIGDELSNDLLLVVPKGAKRKYNYQLAQLGRVIDVTVPGEQVGEDASTVRLNPDSALWEQMPDVTIKESSRLKGSEWLMYPKPGTTPRPVVERLKLRGYENPEVRVKSDQGYLPGGGKVGLFEGGFDADTMAYRYRHITGAVLWDDTWVVRSKGTGTA